MNHVRTILITIALLNIYNLYSAEITVPASQVINIKKPLITDESENFFKSTETPLIEAPTKEKEEEPTVENKEENALDKWNSHLELLRTQNEYWDTANNIPINEWKTTAFDLAEKVLKKDKSLADTLTTSFIDALNAKTTKFTDISLLIDEFKEFIKNQISIIESPQEVKEVAPIPAVPEIIPVPEPIHEQVPVQSETPVTPQEETSTPSTAEQIPKDLKNQWKDILESIKNDESINDPLNKAYELARELLLSGRHPIELERDFNSALIARGTLKKIDPNIINNEINYFKMNIAQQIQPSYYPDSMQQLIPYDLMQQRELEKLQQEYVKKDIKAQEEFEKQRKKEEQERMKLLAAAIKAEEEGKLAQTQVHQLVQLQKEREETIAKQHAKELQEIKKAHDALSKNIEHIAASQKATAEKGILSTLTQAVSDWWYGSGSQKELSLKEQEKLLDMMVQKVSEEERHIAKETFKDFQRILLDFNIPKFWDARREIPNVNWIQHMQELIKTIVITYTIMSLQEISTITKKVLQDSGKISSANLKRTITEIELPTKEVFVEQQRQEAAQRELEQRQQEKKEQKILAQQRIKAEQNRIEAEKQKQVMAETTYRNGKKQWYELLDKVAQNKQATQQENHAHMHNALKQSQSLLQLASDIPVKNKSALAQKLKQTFSIALLEQQKNNPNVINIHHNMDLFNNEINKMMD